MSLYGCQLRLRCDKDAGERMLETKLPSGSMAGEVVGRGGMIGGSIARSAGSMFSLNVELINNIMT